MKLAILICSLCIACGLSPVAAAAPGQSITIASFATDWSKHSVSLTWTAPADLQYGAVTLTTSPPSTCDILSLPGSGRSDICSSVSWSFTPAFLLAPSQSSLTFNTDPWGAPLVAGTYYVHIQGVEPSCYFWYQWLPCQLHSQTVSFQLAYSQALPSPRRHRWIRKLGLGSRTP